MADKEQVIKEKLVNTGIFNYPAVYSYMYDWFKIQEGYGVTEERYSEKVSGNSRAIEAKWVIAKKISDYFRMDFTLEFDVKDLTDVEVEVDGVKKKMNKGKITIELKGYLTKDVESKWDVSPMYRFMRDFYNKYIVPNRVENMQDKIIADTKKFLADVKMFLDIVGKKAY